MQRDTLHGAPLRTQLSCHAHRLQVIAAAPAVQFDGVQKITIVCRDIQCVDCQNITVGLQQVKVLRQIKF